MSGHSHFATIKRQKAAKDAVKGNVFSKMAKAIMIAAKAGADPDSNFKLRVEIDKARSVNMPRENIERAISKATTDAASLDEITYEGFGPFGVSVIVQVATDNKNRAAQEIKNIFEKGGGTMAGPGAVSYNFENKGFLLVKKNGTPDEQMMEIIDMGAEDIVDSQDGFEVYTSPDKLGEVRKALVAKGFEIPETSLQMKPQNYQVVTDPAQQEKVIKFLETMEEHDDVQNVFSNFSLE